MAVGVLAAVLTVGWAAGASALTPGAPAVGRPAAVDPGPAEIGAPAPGFRLPGLRRGTVTLPPGRPAVVNFWASWCNPCRKEFPLLGRAQRRYAEAGLEVIGVSYRDIADDARRFVAQEDAEWAFARDPDGRLAAAYGVRGIPQTFFVAADGTLVSRIFGFTTYADLRAEIRKIVPARSG